VRPYRSLLFVPAHKDTWVAKALAAGPDAVILDLEDAVPDAEKPRAREVLADSIAEARRTDAGVGIFVRPNSWESRAFAPDLEAAVVPGLDGLLLPKLYGEADVLRFDAVLTYLELQAGIAEGAVELIATLETAESLDACERIARAPRVVSMLGATARDADVQRAVGYRWTAEGLETLYLRSRVVLACRAAGLSHPVCGLWQDLRDLDGLARFAAANRDLGYRGQVLIHPSHVERVNEVFTPTQEEVAFYRGMIRAFEEAEAAGSAAVDYEGQHVDRAHYLTARETVAFAEGLA
jgi:citrate lyase subunit beta / citryl-CoA lyase